MSAGSNSAVLAAGAALEIRSTNHISPKKTAARPSCCGLQRPALVVNETRTGARGTASALWKDVNRSEFSIYSYRQFDFSFTGTDQILRVGQNAACL